MVARPSPDRSLVTIRHDLEEIDRAIVLLIAARVEAARTAIRVRSREDGSVSDPEQEARVIARAQSWAEQAGLSPDRMGTIFRAVVEAGKEEFTAHRPRLRPPTGSSGARRTGRARGRGSARRSSP